MCTVSFVFENNSFILTSNRDEKITRPRAIEPKIYQLNSKKIIYPKDEKAGGTWFVVDEFGNTIILLNGGKTKHIAKSNYRLSRGLIVLELIQSKTIIDTWQNINLIDIEPFTLLVLENNIPFELQWNGEVKYTNSLDINKKYIWSSSTLYAPEIQEIRSKWFYNYLNENKVITPETMLFFHKNTAPKDATNGLIIDRDNIYKTLSVSQVVISNSEILINHSDLVNNEKYSLTF